MKKTPEKLLNLKEVRVRNIRVEDIPKIYALGEKIFSAGDSVTLYRTWDQYEIAQLFFADTEHCLVAEHDQKLAGFILGTMVEKPRTGRRYGYVLWLGVSKPWQRSGLGSMLLRRLVRRFKKHGAHMLLADTAAENEKAVRFFGSHGFTGRQEHVYLSKNLVQ